MDVVGGCGGFWLVFASFDWGLAVMGEQMDLLSITPVIFICMKQSNRGNWRFGTMVESTFTEKEREVEVLAG